jgi:hypothetical protein
VSGTDLDVPGLAFQTQEELGDDWYKIIIHGPQGAGKTALAGTIAECGKTLYLDLPGEKGVRSLRGAPFEKNITFVRPKSITMLDDIFWRLAEGDHDFQAVVIDSMTSVQKMAMRFMLGHSETAVREIKTGTAPADQRTWGQTLDIMVDTATFWFGLADAQLDHPMHVVMTAQTVMVDNEDSGTRDRCPDVQKGARSISLAAPDYILYVEVEENMDYLADDTLPPVNHVVRFGAHPGYRTKARVPYHLRGKIPPILGRSKPVNLVQLGRVLGVGGMPAAPVAAKKTAAKVTASREKETA